MSEEGGWRSTAKGLRETPKSPERRPIGDVPEIYEFGPFRLEPAERKLLRGSAVVTLTPKAFDTLHLLVRNSGHLLEKDELVRMLWPDSFVEEGNLTNNIFLFRRRVIGSWGLFDGYRQPSWCGRTSQIAGKTALKPRRRAVGTHRCRWNRLMGRRRT